MEIEKILKRLRQEGYNEENAQAKLCQDIILDKISKCDLNRKVTIKGGVVMRSISKNIRRATQDIDIDLIQYSLNDESICQFIERLNQIGDMRIEIIGELEGLKQQNYSGKRAYIRITDQFGKYMNSKVDIGVHKHMDLVQEEYCFDVGYNNEGASLLINSKEQMLTEKLKSILKFGSFSSRYKDVYDIYYLFELADKDKLYQCFQILIFDDDGMRENSIEDIYNRVESTFNNKGYQKKIATSKRNWLGADNKEVFDFILKSLFSFIADQNKQGD